MDALVTIANLFFISSYAVKDLLTLRMLSFTGACCLAAYFGLRDEPLLQVAAWNCVFATLNLAWICRLLVARCVRRRNAAGTS